MSTRYQRKLAGELFVLLREVHPPLSGLGAREVSEVLSSIRKIDHLLRDRELLGRLRRDPELPRLILLQLLDGLSVRRPAKLVEEGAPQRSPTALAAAGRTFGFLELLLPDRVAVEELGDATEVIYSLSRRGEPPWKIYLKIASTVLWVSINVLREVTGAFLGRLRRG